MHKVGLYEYKKSYGARALYEMAENTQVNGGRFTPKSVDLQLIYFYP